MNIHTNIFNSHTGYDVIIYFWSGVIAEKKLSKIQLQAEFLESGSSEWMTKFYTLIVDNLPHEPAGNDVTDSFQSGAKCN